MSQACASAYILASASTCTRVQWLLFSSSFPILLQCPLLVDSNQNLKTHQGDPSHRASSCRVPLLAPLLCLCRHLGVVTAPTVAKSRVFQSATLLFSLDSAHTFINSLFVKFASVSPFGIAICFLWDLTDTILDILYTYIIHLLSCTSFIYCMQCVPQVFLGTIQDFALASSLRSIAHRLWEERTGVGIPVPCR